MKRISRRRLLASGLVLPSSAYLSSAGLPPAVVPPALAQDAAAAEATLNPDLTSGKELYLLCWDNYKATGMETWLADFEAEMGGRVVLDKVASNSLQDKQIVSLSGQTGEYDLMTVDEPYMPAYSPYLMDLTPLIERDGFPVDDWVPVMWDAGVYEGKVYGIPFDPNVQILYYRQDLLDAQELEVPTTWTGIYDAAMAAQDRDNELWGMAIMTKRDPQTGINLWTFINAWGNELFDENYQAAFVNDQGYAAAEFFKQVADNIAPSGHAGYDYAGISDSFATGKSVFMYNWASNTLNVTEGENSVVADTVGFAPAPGEERALSMRGVWTIGIPAAAPNPEAAWEFIKWFTTQESQFKYIEGGSGKSPRLSVLDSERFKETSPDSEAVAETMKIAKKRPIFKEYEEINTQLQIFASQLTAGELTPQETIDGLAAELNAIMQAGGYQG